MACVFLAPSLSGGGLGLLLPDRRQWNAAVGSIGRDPNLITKEILRNTSTIKILFPRGASELGSYSGQFLLNYLGKKNGMDTSRTTVIKQTQSFAIIRGPSSILSRFATDGRIFLGLASCKVAKMSSKGSLCYRCGRYHPIGGNNPCSAPARCVRCGGQHSLELCPQPKYFRGLRSCSNCDGPHSAIEHCCKPIYVRNGNPPRRETTGREVPTTADDRSDGTAVDMAVDALSPVALEDGRDD
ncbi:hypothetical protein Pmar_PMAR028936 [Perkinsus marinus ATCC 50983]|uniref:Uncharacterized protein n=1 Tax=Perkinsus marinus (strain ATCC 50983 / TXsc) TaxID=423536 RepID=C5LCU4_PERM5|nr:hypothetical protein Pmar_PMAR028936 [Perkinsus marinus ATCC 50983]EER05447.1 hypothetical protein Pmar_PMAR028936 [Perkinsus marinus ATCC 50983]|eukprot:XP_002773631.1 hypothetical protein Pmar_PMAR028936 [Perkinsus marinus ATCC 50983]